VCREKPYACSLCEQAFIQKGGLKIHSALHAKHMVVQGQKFSPDSEINGYKMEVLLEYRRQTYAKRVSDDPENDDEDATLM